MPKKPRENQLSFEGMAPLQTKSPKKLGFRPSIVRQMGLEVWRNEWRDGTKKGYAFRKAYREWAWKQVEKENAYSFTLLDPFKSVIFKFTVVLCFEY